MPHDTPRYAAIDALRGAACVWMAAYHFCFDLYVFGWQPRWNFYNDPFWTWQRTAILSTFLLCAGMGQGIASRQGQSWARFWQRWWQIALCALLVSAGSYWAFKNRFISFGVLHGMAVMLLVVRVLAPRLSAKSLLLLGALPIVLHGVYQHIVLGAYLPPAALDTRWLNGLGLVSHKPATEDYVPLLPWLGVMLLGAALGGRVQMKAQASATLAVQGSVHQPLALSFAPLRALRWLGQRSLRFYMLHQLVFWGLLYAAAWAGLHP